MKNRSAFILFSILLAACAAPSPTPVPTIASTPATALTPNLSSASTRIPEPTRTLSHAETIASHLASLPGFQWRVNGDQINLVNEQDVVATYDRKNGGISWSGDFGLLDRYIKADASPADKTTFAGFMKSLDGQGVHFISYPSAQEKNGYTPPPNFIMMTPDGKYSAFPSPRGTRHFGYDPDSKRITILNKHDQLMYFVNPDGKLNDKPLRDLVNKIELKGFAKEDEVKVREAVLQASKMYPYGYTPEKLNQIFNSVSNGGPDLRTFFNDKFKAFPRATFDALIEGASAKDPFELLDRAASYGTIIYKPTAPYTTENDKGEIYLNKTDLNDPNRRPYTLLKELWSSPYRSEAFKLGVKDILNMGTISETLSIMTQVVVKIENHASQDSINFSVDWTYKGGIVNVY